MSRIWEEGGSAPRRYWVVEVVSVVVVASVDDGAGASSMMTVLQELSRAESGPDTNMRSAHGLLTQFPLLPATFLRNFSARSSRLPVL